VTAKLWRHHPRYAEINFHNGRICFGDENRCAQVIKSKEGVSHSPVDLPPDASYYPADVMTIPNVGQVLGHYRIVEQVGSGGMGVVFRARDEQLDRDVALKILPELARLSESARRQFRREALGLAKITDPNVAIAFDFGHDSGFDYLVTEYVQGPTLDAKIAGRPLKESEVLQLGKNLASGLEVAHGKGVIHRDLKPSNLKVTPEGQLKILDFGLAYLLKTGMETTANAPLTETYSNAGTLPYMSPEQIKGQKPDARADLWSAGAVLYEMSTGRRPFGVLTGAQLILAILQQPLISPRQVNPEISAGLECVIVRALHKDPKQRYQSAGDMRIDLANLATGTMPTQPTPQLWGSWDRAVLLFAILIGFALVGKWAWHKHHQSGSTPPEQRMMAVLPFESVTNDPPTNALGLGLTATVTAKLVQAVDGGHLELVSTRELIAKGVRTSDEARRQFGTDLALEGNLQQNGSRIRITWSLVNPRTHTQIAANTITGEANDIFGLQDGLVDEVLEKLPLGAEPARRQALQGAPDTKPAAYDFYLRGRGYLEDYQSADNIQNAITQFEHAVAVDKNYAPAYAAMGLAYNIGFQWKNRGKDWVEKARRQCEIALAISPHLAEGHTCLGNVDVSTGRYEDAVHQFQQSLDLDHTSDETLRSLAAAYQKLGNASAAEEAYRKAISLRPNYWGVYSAFGTFYYNQAQYAGAAAMFKKAIQLAPLNYNGYSNLGAMYLLLGNYNESVEALKESAALRPTFEAYGNLGAAYFYMRRYAESADSLQQALKIDDKDWLNWGNLGDTLYQIPERRQDGMKAYRQAIALARPRLDLNARDSFTLAFVADYHAMLGEERLSREAMARALEITPTDADVLFRAAIVYNHFGETEKTLDFLGKSVAAGYSRTVIRDTPDFDHLRHDTHFLALLPKS
jgi:eukaryotic-like serine/threonine-protein kinase